MLGLKLIHVSKRGPSCYSTAYCEQWSYISSGDIITSHIGCNTGTLDMKKLLHPLVFCQTHSHLFLLTSLSIPIITHSVEHNSRTLTEVNTVRIVTDILSAEVHIWKLHPKTLHNQQWHPCFNVISSTAHSCTPMNTMVSTSTYLHSVYGLQGSSTAMLKLNPHNDV